MATGLLSQLKQKDCYPFFVFLFNQRHVHTLSNSLTNCWSCFWEYISFAGHLEVVLWRPYSPWIWWCVWFVFVFLPRLSSPRCDVFLFKSFISPCNQPIWLSLPQHGWLSVSDWNYFEQYFSDLVTAWQVARECKRKFIHSNSYFQIHYCAPHLWPPQESKRKYPLSFPLCTLFCLIVIERSLSPSLSASFIS